MTKWQTSSITILMFFFFSVFTPLSSANANENIVAPKLSCEAYSMPMLCNDVSLHYGSFSANALSEYVLTELMPNQSNPRLPYFAYAMMFITLIVVLLLDEKEMVRLQRADRSEQR